MLLSAGVHAAVFTLPHFGRPVPVVTDPTLHALMIIEATPYVSPLERARMAMIALPQPPVLPAISTIASLNLDVPVVEFPARPFDIPVPASSVDADELEGYTSFLPSMVAPRLMNRARVQQELQKRYPRHHRDTGVGAMIVVMMWIDEEGTVQKYQLQRSSGTSAFDRAVEEVIPLMELSPPLRNGRPVRVVVTLPIAFNVR